MTKTYTYTDYCGNVHTMFVRDDGRVLMCNQHRIAECLSNVGFLTAGNGTEEQRRIVREAALKGLDTLRSVTKLDWRQA